MMTSHDPRLPKAIAADHEQSREPDMRLITFKFADRFFDGHRCYGTAFGTARKVMIQLFFVFTNVAMSVLSFLKVLKL